MRSVTLQVTEMSFTISDAAETGPNPSDLPFGIDVSGAVHVLPS